MSFIDIVCLANSRKMSGRCIAGKAMGSGKWIRPVSNPKGGKISEVDRQFKNGQMPQLLDIMRISVKKHCSELFQTENYLIDKSSAWVKKGIFTDKLDCLEDTPEDIWGTGFSTHLGINDRFPEKDNEAYSQSLYLIKPDKLKIIVKIEYPGYDYEKRKVRVEFIYNNVKYRFPLTDPITEAKWFSKEDGNYELAVDNTYLCVSVGLPYKEYCYKFVASILVFG